MKWATFKSLKTWLRNAWKASNLQSRRSLQAKKHVALKKIERDFADETIRANFEKFAKDARKLAAEFTPRRDGNVYLESDCSRPDSLPEVEIARENHCHLKPSGNGFGGKGKGGQRRGDDRRRIAVETTVVVVVMISKRSRGNDRFDKDRRYRNKDSKTRTLQVKRKLGFVIRNKGDK